MRLFTTLGWHRDYLVSLPGINLLSGMEPNPCLYCLNKNIQQVFKLQIIRMLLRTFYLILFWYENK